jgi:hypothetical protein
MINKAVFSYYNKAGVSNTSGFLTFQDMLASTCLAVLTAKKHFPKVTFVTHDFGLRVFRDILKLPVDFTTELNQMDGVSDFWWAYGKVIAYSSQNEPFVHIDNDAYLFSGLPKRMLEAELVFQSKEFMDKPGYGWYNILKPCWREAVVKPKQIVNITDYAYNCGIAGGNNFEFFKEHQKCSAEYIFSPENQDLLFKKYKDILIHQNLFHEQYFIASLVKAKKLRNKVEVLSDNIEDINKCGVSYCHLWGLSKRHEKNIFKLYNRLNKDFPEFYNKVKTFPLSLLK